MFVSCSSSGFCLLTVYLVGGFLYQRLIVGAKGMEQFPNYTFWVEVGNLAAVNPEQWIMNISRLFNFGFKFIFF